MPVAALILNQYALAGTDQGAEPGRAARLGMSAKPRRASLDDLALDLDRKSVV